jgi:hypothetical protein
MEIQKRHCSTVPKLTGPFPLWSSMKIGDPGRRRWEVAPSQSRLASGEIGGGTMPSARLRRKEAIWGKIGIESSSKRLPHGGGSSRWGTVARGPVRRSWRSTHGLGRICTSMQPLWQQKRRRREGDVSCPHGGGLGCLGGGTTAAGAQKRSLVNQNHMSDG